LINFARYFDIDLKSFPVQCGLAVNLLAEEFYRNKRSTLLTDVF